ncbi:MAG: CBS domain-containing protein [Candidatus Hydrothermarchaeota archaeon]
MKTVGEVMTREVVTFQPGASVAEVARALRERGISGGPVVDGGRVVGIVSEADLLRLLESYQMRIETFLPTPFDILELPVRMGLSLKGLEERAKRTSATKVEEVMTREVVSIGSDAPIGEAARLMMAKGVNRLPVLDREKRLVGIVTRGDLVSSLA